MATLTQSQFDFAYIRRSEEDFKRIMDAVRADGSLTIEPDAPVEDPEPLLDAEGNEVKDEDGNTVMQPVSVDIPTDLDIAIDNMPEEGEPKIPEDIVVEVAPGTQNAAAPFPDTEGSKSGRRRSSRSRDREKTEA